MTEKELLAELSTLYNNDKITKSLSYSLSQINTIDSIVEKIKSDTKSQIVKLNNWKNNIVIDAIAELKEVNNDN